MSDYYEIGTFTPWDEIDKHTNHIGLNADYEEARKNEFQKVPYGDYIVKVDELKLKLNKKKVPMFVCKFKVSAGEYKNRPIFMYKTLSNGVSINSVFIFLNSLKPEILFDKWINYNTFAHQLAKTDVYLMESKLSYLLNYSIKKEFDTFKILDVMEQQQ